MSTERHNQRRGDILAANNARKINSEKVLVPVDARTKVLVPKHLADEHMKKYRLKVSSDPRNARKSEYLQSKGWSLRSDGIWVNKYGFLKKEFETALIVSGYYESLKKAEG